MAQVIIFSDVLAAGFGRAAGPYRLATELRRADYSAQVVEFYSFFSKKEILQILDKFVTPETLLVGISAVFLNESYEDINREGHVRRQFPYNWYHDDPRVESELEFMRFLFSEVKKRNPRCKTAIGAGQIEDLLQFNTSADLFVIGAADRAILDIAGLIKNSKKIDPLEIPKVVNANSEYPFEGFNECQIKYEKSDNIRKNEFLPLEFSRGCIFKCAFCEFPGTGKKKGTFQKTPETLREELIDNYERFGVSEYVFMDNILNDDLEKMKIIRDTFKNLPFQVRWFSFARIDLYTKYPEMIGLAKESGCIGHFFGIETLSKGARKFLGKGPSPERDVETMRNLRRELGPEFNIFAAFIVGLPGERWDEMERTHEWLMSEDSPIDSWGFNPLYIDKTSHVPYALNPARYGLRFPDPDDVLYWEHEITNAREAEKRASDFLIRSSFKNRLGGFKLFRLMNLGFKYDQLRKLTLLESHAMQEEFLGRTLKLKNDYFLNLLRA